MSTGGPLEGPWAKAGAIAGVLGTIAAVVFGIVQLTSGTNTGTAPELAPSTSAPASAASESTSPPNTRSTSSTNTDESASDATDNSDSNGTSNANSTKYLSEVRITDHDSQSSTGGWEIGAKDINGEQFGHSIMTYAGCQNADGGDFWVDLTIGSGWRQLEGKVGLDGDSSVDSAGSWRLLDPLTGQELASGKMSAGPGASITANLDGVTRLRLFMNNPNAPHQSCGFAKIRTRLVWGDVRLSK